MQTTSNANPLHTNFLVTARQSAVISGMREIWTSAGGFVRTEDLSHCIRGMRRAWNTGNAQILRDWLESVAVLAETVEGAYDLTAKCREVSSLVLGLEVFA